jgi:arabinogalactan oligomer/maltooligosaccharide transport system substrate-binding protein
MTSFRRKWLAVVPLTALVLAACGGDDDAADEPAPVEEPTDEATDDEPADDDADADATDEEATDEEAAADEGEEEGPEEVERADADLVIWADDTRTPVIEPFAEQFAEEQGITVAVQEVPEEDMRDLVSLQAPAGEGPDVFIGAHDWLGQLVEDGVVAQLDLGGAEGEYLDVAIEAFNYEGTNYGLPYSIENIALFRNTELVPEPVDSLEEMAEVATQLVDDGEAEIPVGWQQPDVYHNYWVVTATGGYVFGQDEDGSYDASDVGIDSDGALEAANLFADLTEQGVVSQDVDYDVMIDTFSRGAAPFAVTGPWAIADFEGGDVEFAIDPLPSVEGDTPAPFVGVQGFMMSAFTEQELAARTFVLDFMGTEDAQLELYEAGNRPPALQSAFDQVADDDMVAGFGEAGAEGAPMPAIPQMGSVWDAWTNAYINILSGQDAEAAFEEAAEQVRTLIDL